MDELDRVELNPEHEEALIVLAQQVRALKERLGWYQTERDSMLEEVAEAKRLCVSMQDAAISIYEKLRANEQEMVALQKALDVKPKTVIREIVKEKQVVRIVRVPREELTPDELENAPDLPLEPDTESVTDAK